jgi:hypothetical protein
MLTTLLTIAALIIIIPVVIQLLIGILFLVLLATGVIVKVGNRRYTWKK